MSKPGTVLFDRLQDQAVSAAMLAQQPLPFAWRDLTQSQASLLRIIAENPGQSPYRLGGQAGIPDGTVRAALRALAERGIEPHSEEWKKSIAETIARQKEAMKPRLFPTIPPNRYLCFYPMDRRRGEDKNWYTLPMEERQRQMNEHGMVGRRYAGEVKQTITGSIRFDDWEWGADLFADDPLVFKKLIYEMRFDQVSAVYALFGSFYIGLRVPANRLYDLLEGNLPL